MALEPKKKKFQYCISWVDKNLVSSHFKPTSPNKRRNTVRSYAFRKGHRDEVDPASDAFFIYTLGKANPKNDIVRAVNLGHFSDEWTLAKLANLLNLGYFFCLTVSRLVWTIKKKTETWNGEDIALAGEAFPSLRNPERVSSIEKNIPFLHNRARCFEAFQTEECFEKVVSISSRQADFQVVVSLFHITLVTYNIVSILKDRVKDAPMMEYRVSTTFENGLRSPQRNGFWFFFLFAEIIPLKNASCEGSRRRQVLNTPKLNTHSPNKYSFWINIFFPCLFFAVE